MKSLFSFSGRINRQKFYIASIFVFVIYYILVPYMKQQDISFSIINVVMLLNIIVYLSFIVRRLHDIGYSGLNILIPLYNIYIFLLALFKEGELKTNKYGENPLKTKESTIY